ncbi:MAG: SDR family NAD(P)-dependent oxidoreductase, partial [Bacillota bacterium]|nr:SDR family NAD(P)-dependent oxidoreductase [Bacillota bacterium]
SLSSKQNSRTGEEVILFSGDNFEELKYSFEEFVKDQNDHTDFEKSVFNNNLRAFVDKEWRIAICARSLDELKEKWDFAKKSISEDRLNEEHILKLKGIFVGRGSSITSDKIALMFPGQASQYPNMLKELIEHYPLVKSFYMQADNIWKAKYDYSILPIIFGENEDEIKDQLKDTKNTHPAIFLSNIALYKLITEAGVKADYMIGHSLGEITSLFAGEMLDLKSALYLIHERGFSFDQIEPSNRGQMVSIKSKYSEVDELIKNNGFDLSIANINSTEQTVVGGEEKEIKRLTELLKDKKVTYTVLNVSHAFHTKLTKKAAENFREKIGKLIFKRPKSNIMACHLSDFYPEAKNKLGQVADILKDQITSPVNFVEAVQKLYDKGVRVFIETGPSSVLTNLVNNILHDKDILVIPVNNNSKGSVEGFKYALAALFAAGVDISMVPSKNIIGVSENEQITINISQAALQAGKISEDIAATNDKPYGIVKSDCRELSGITSGSEIKKESIVYSGVSVGLPGSFKKAFSDDNFDLLFEGTNLIEMLTEEEQKRILELNITRLIKKEKEITFKKVASLNEVIQFAGRLGKLNMLEDYLIDEKTLKQITFSSCAGIAAGYEAIKDAGIPLIREQVKTSSGTILPGRLLLPEEMRDNTGIIFATGFFLIENVIADVSKFTASKFSVKPKIDIINFYESVISKVSDLNSKKILTDWFNSHYSKLNDNCSEKDLYEFNHNFMTSITCNANNKLAQLIGATGPNFVISAACSSTASSVSVAEDMIRAGRAKRVIVVGVDHLNSEDMLAWIGAGFYSMGVLTDSHDLFEAAVPFDNRRNGVIMGSGSVGLVVEREADVAERGMNGICRILGTHLFNSAGHNSKIDTNRHCIELDRFLTRIEREYDIRRDNIASKTVYCSHETYSIKNGGCAQMEKTALESAFGEKFKDIKVINTKGMTGHTLGASIEEAVSAKALQFQKIPPISNYKEADPDLKGLNLSKGGSYEFDYVLRSVTALGGHGNYHLLQKVAYGDDRIIDKRLYEKWLERITAAKDVKLNYQGRILVAQGNNEYGHSHEFLKEKKAVNNKIEDKEETPSYNGANILNSRVDGLDIKNKVLGAYSEITKYPIDMLDIRMELEADLGIDTVKQATIFSRISEMFNINYDGGLALSNYTTIGSIIELISSKMGNSVNNNFSNIITEKSSNTELSNYEDSSKNSYENDVLEVISEITMYPKEMLEKDMEMEADLGIDTVKQATIFSILAEKLGISEEMSGNISKYKTIGALIDLVNSCKGSFKTDNNIAVSAFGKKELGSAAKNSAIVSSNIYNVTNYAQKVNGDNKDGNINSGASTFNKENIKNPNSEKKADSKPISIEDDILEIISSISKYPVEILESEMEFEADLGIDTIKQATIFSEVGIKFKIGDEAVLSPSKLKTVGAIINFVKEEIGKKSENGKIETKNSAASNSSKDTERIDEEHGLMSTNERELCLNIPVIVEEVLNHSDFNLNDKNILIMGDSIDAVNEIADYFLKYSNSVDKFIFASNIDEERLKSNIIDFSSKRIEVIIDLTQIGLNIEFDTLSREDEQKNLYLSSQARFLFYKKLFETDQQPVIKILGVISMDGAFGYSGKLKYGINPFFGAVSGFYKGLRKEFSQSEVKILDLGAFDRIIQNEEAIKRIVNEIEGSNASYEVGCVDGKRVVIKLDNMDRSDLIDSQQLQNSHFLVTGGGNGITSEILKELSKSIKGKYTIVGRTKLPINIDELSKLDNQALEQKKSEIHNRLKKEGKKASPAEVQKEYEKIIKAVSVHKLINEIQENGSEVIYKACDVRDYDGLQAVIDDSIKVHGPVNVLIHAAGLEKSRLIAQKTTEEFNEIFSVKAQGLCNLYRILDKGKLSTIIGFSSISGRFGNEAQLDYCSANNFISGFMAMLKAHDKGIRALSIVWSGWKDTGMAWRNEFVKENSEEMGLHMIEPERGASEFVNILKGNLNCSELVVSKGLSPFNGSLIELGCSNKTPFLDWITKKDGKIDKAFKVLSVKRDPIINNHRLGNTPLMPAVGFMEICAEYHSLIFGKKEQYCFRDILLSNPLKLFHDNSQEIIIKPSVLDKDDSFEVVFYNHFQPKFGEGRLTELNRMKVSSILGEYHYLSNLRELEHYEMKVDSSKKLMDSSLEKLQNSINLGSLFVDEKCAKYNNIKYNNTGAIYSILLSEEQVANKKYDLENLLINPVFMDSLMQACGIHSSRIGDRVYLPWKVDEFGVVKTARELGGYKAYAKLIIDSDELKTYDVILYNDNDEVCYYAKGVTVRRINL